jgi:uncharacterized NAD(P)/FAD-binding protein YdhS
MAPDAAAGLARLRAEGRLTGEAGRVRSLEPGAPGQVLAAISPWGGGAAHVRVFHRVVGCLGVTPMRPGNPVLESLLSQGTLALDPLGLGPALADDGSFPGAPGLYAVGPLCRGRDWESTAVPELRAQAARLAPVLARRLGTT